MSDTTSNTIPMSSGCNPGGLHLTGREGAMAVRSEKAADEMIHGFKNKVLAGGQSLAGQGNGNQGSGGLRITSASNAKAIGADTESATGFVRGVDTRSASRFSKLDIMPKCSWMPRSGGRSIREAA